MALQLYARTVIEVFRSDAIGLCPIGGVPLTPNILIYTWPSSTTSKVRHALGHYIPNILDSVAKNTELLHVFVYMSSFVHDTDALITLRTCNALVTIRYDDYMAFSYTNAYLCATHLRHHILAKPHVFRQRVWCECVRTDHGRLIQPRGNAIMYVDIDVTINGVPHKWPCQEGVYFFLAASSRVLQAMPAECNVLTLDNIQHVLTMSHARRIAIGTPRVIMVGYSHGRVYARTRGSTHIRRQKVLNQMLLILLQRVYFA
ncbi:ORF95R [Turbot reddish body iridovirus]|uniref:ORF95R n=1 Tax=Turbot reddish body iridovirus TaxID=273651 RepID=E2CU40_ISKNV|nr:ORF95R [Turbot reddish body iridovirus]